MTPPETINVLRESEIQERLYGAYLGRRPPRREPVSSQPAPPVPEVQEEWTGVEILKGELQTLRSELIRLRREKESLVTEMSRRSLPLTPAGQKRGGRLFILGLGAAVLLGLFSFSVGGRFLQASPALTEPTPYTIQVAVYNIQGQAQRAVAALGELGFPAFGVESSRRRGGTHYRVYIGRFVSKAEAEEERIRLLADPRFSMFQDAFVRIQ